MAEPTDRPTRLATHLLLLARNPATGRIGRPRTLDIGLRAALFCDLILEGRLVSRDGAPFAFGVQDSGDHVLDTVAGAVNKRQNVPWWRWYRHVRADRAILIKELVDSGRWTRRPGGPFARYDDTDDLAPQALARHLQGVLASEQIANAREGILAVLTVMCGTGGRMAHPRALRKELKPIVDKIVATDEPGAEFVPTALAGATVLLRKPHRR